MKRSGIKEKLSLAVLMIVLFSSLLCLSIDAEADGSVLSYQVTEGIDGVFSLRVIAGVNSLDYEKVGYVITLVSKDAEGKDVTDTLVGETSIVYSSLYGGGAYHSVKDNFGYEYAALATVKKLPINSSYVKIEVHTYVVSVDGTTMDGDGATLLYEGRYGGDGYPILSFTPIRDQVIDSGSMLREASAEEEVLSIDWNEFRKQ